jgi:hypothetical protein
MLFNSVKNGKFSADVHKSNCSVIIVWLWNMVSFEDRTENTSAEKVVFEICLKMWSNPVMNIIHAEDLIIYFAYPVLVQ